MGGACRWFKPGLNGEWLSASPSARHGLCGHERAQPGGAAVRRAGAPGCGGFGAQRRATWVAVAAQALDECAEVSRPLRAPIDLCLSLPTAPPGATPSPHSLHSLRPSCSVLGGQLHDSLHGRPRPVHQVRPTRALPSTAREGSASITWRAGSGRARIQAVTMPAPVRAASSALICCPHLLPPLLVL